MFFLRVLVQLHSLTLKALELIVLCSHLKFKDVEGRQKWLRVRSTCFDDGVLAVNKITCCIAC